MSLNFGRGLLKGVEAAGSSYADSLKEKGKRDYEDQKAQAFYNRQVSLEGIRATNASNLAGEKADYSATAAGKLSEYNIARDTNKITMAEQASERERVRIKKAAADQLVTDTQAKIDAGLLDAEEGAGIIEGLKSGVTPSLLIASEGKALDTKSLKELSDVAKNTFGEGTPEAAEFMKMAATRREGKKGGRITSAKTATRKEAQVQASVAQEVAATTQEITGKSPIELRAYREEMMKEATPEVQQSAEFIAALGVVDGALEKAGVPDATVAPARKGLLKNIEGSLGSRVVRRGTEAVKNVMDLGDYTPDESIYWK